MSETHKPLCPMTDPVLDENSYCDCFDHTLVPWLQEDNYVITETFTAVAFCNDSYGNNGEANAERIVACVNACAGMADPIKEVEALLSLEYATRHGQVDNPNDQK